MTIDWNRRITREPAAPVGDDVLADAVKWAHTLEMHSGYIYDRLTPDDVRRLDVLVAAASRAPTEAQRREIANIVRVIDEYTTLPLNNDYARLVAALRAAGIIGGEHD